MLDLRTALSGTWATNARGLSILFIPAFLLVLFQESTHGPIVLELVIISSIAQHIASAALMIAVAVVARLQWGRVPLGVNLALWIVVGITRGLISGWLFLVIDTQTTPGHDDPQLLVRCAYWVSICVIWFPIFIYTAAQVDHRRSLLRELRAATEERDEARGRAESTTGELSARLVSAVRDAISPVIADISRSLEALGSQLAPTAFAAIGERIAQVSHDATNIISGADARPTPRQPDAQPLTPIAAAMDFERERPVLAGALTGVALTAVVLPNAFIAGGPDDVIQAIIALPMSTVVLIGLVVAQSRLRDRSERHLAVLLTTYLAAGLAGSFVLVVVNAGSLDTYDASLIVLFPIAVVLCAITMSSAVGLASANRELLERITSVREEALNLRETAEEKERQVRSSLSILMHGPVQGRLSACVMALTFHAQEGPDVDPERTAFITNAVLEHLETASRDLDALVATDTAGAAALDSQA